MESQDDIFGVSDSAMLGTRGAMERALSGRKSEIENERNTTRMIERP